MGVGNIWEQLVAGGPRQLVTHFTSDKIFYFRLVARRPLGALTRHRSDRRGVDQEFPMIGNMISHYRIVEKLRGGIGVVFAVEQILRLQKAKTAPAQPKRGFRPKTGFLESGRRTGRRSKGRVGARQRRRTLARANDLRNGGPWSAIVAQLCHIR